MADYLERYYVERDITVHTGQEVISAHFNDAKSQWTVISRGLNGEQTWEASALVIATGFYGAPFLPGTLGDFHGTSIHSSQYKTGTDFAGQKVLVVGIGNSGSEQLVDLWESGAKPSVLIRSPPLVLPRWVLGWTENLCQADWMCDTEQKKTLHTLLLNEICAWVSNHEYRHLEACCGLSLSRESLAAYKSRKKQPPVVDNGSMALLESGQVPVIQDELQRFTSDGVVFGSGKEEKFDAVVWATGFECKSDNYAPFLDAALLERIRQLGANEDIFFPLNDENPIPYLYLALNPNMASAKHRAPKLATKIVRDKGMAGKLATPERLKKLQSRLSGLRSYMQCKKLTAEAATNRTCDASSA